MARAGTDHLCANEGMRIHEVTVQVSRCCPTINRHGLISHTRKMHFKRASILTCPDLCLRFLDSYSKHRLCGLVTRRTLKVASEWNGCVILLELKKNRRLMKSRFVARGGQVHVRSAHEWYASKQHAKDSPNPMRIPARV
jgi:hypothetical protein